MGEGGAQPQATGRSPRYGKPEGGKDFSVANCPKQLLTQTSEFLWKRK